MNLDTLKYFHYIAKYRNITKAAKHFFVSQSTLSRHIINLESELGVKLFERDNKKVELTEAGKVLYKECDLLIKHLETVINNVQSAGQGNLGILRITAPGKLCNTLSEALNLMREKYPSIELIIETYNFDEIPCAVLYGIYHIGFTYDFAFFDYEELESIPIGTEDFSLIVPSKLIKNPSIESIGEIAKSLPLILPSYIEPPFLNLIIHELKHFAGVKKINTLYVNNSDSVIFDVSMGLGYSIVPTSLTKNKYGTDNIYYIELKEFSTKCTIVMLYKKSYVSEPPINAFINIIKEVSNKN